MHQYKRKPNRQRFYGHLSRNLSFMLYSFRNSIPIVCLGVLLFLNYIMLSAPVVQSTYAETNTSQTFDESASVELIVANSTLSKESNINEVNYISTNLALTATNIDKYSIFLQAADGESGFLTGEQKGIELAGVGKKVMPAVFQDNTWGYSLMPGEILENQFSTLSYNSVPAYNEVPLTPAYSQQDFNEAASGKNFTLVFAAKFSHITIPDHYKAAVVVSVAANPQEVTNAFDQVDYLQDLTSDICRLAFSNSSKQLTDNRDNKNYWVAKLDDGNCWMTQNLDYDGGGTTVTSLNGGDLQGSPTSYPQWQDDKTLSEYYDPGNYYWTPNNWDECSMTTSGFSDCSANGWPSTGDAHYHVGNFYSWQATQQGNICPSGWQLPTSNTSDNGSFGKMLSDSHLYSSPNNVKKFITSPYYFIPGGYIRTSGLNRASNQGFYWASTAVDPDFAYGLDFTQDAINPNSNNSRYNGANVRCLVLSS